MNPSIAFIIPNTKVAETISKVLIQCGEEYPVVFGSTGAALDEARRMQRLGACVIVSIGTTARYLQAKMEIPVLEMPFSSVEFIRAINQALRHSNKILMILSSNVGYSVQQILAIFENTDAVIDVKEYSPDYPLPAQAEEFIRQGDYDVVVSSTPGVEAAVRLGKIGILHDIDPKMVEVSLANAKSLAQVERNRAVRDRMVQAVIDYSPEGMILVDTKNSVRMMNYAAGRLIGLNIDEARGRPIRQIFAQQRIIDVLESAQHAGREDGVHVAVRRVPLPDTLENGGELLLVQDAQELHEMSLRAQKNLHSKGHVAKKTLADIVGDSVAISHAKHLARTFAAYDSTVLLAGETGTGKELFAQSIHAESPRRKQPFVAVNCAALPESLLESELFGYVKGAFTGARSEGKIGVFEMAHTGTLFLDEIGEISLATQARLLRVLQEKEMMRIGDDQLRSIDVRIVSATNRNLPALVQEGKFREDLYYRLCVLELRVPPLRERPGDIAGIVHTLIQHKNMQLGTAVSAVEPKVLDWMVAQPWRGNVRELENLLEKLMILTGKGVIRAALLQEISNVWGTGMTALQEKILPLRTAELQYLERALAYTNGNRAACARLLEIDPSTLWRKLNRSST